MPKQVRFIYASTPSGVIGSEGKLPWRLPEDLKIFKEKTLFGNCLMGRLTYDSLPPSIKPLPNRNSFIVTRDNSYSEIPHAKVVKDPVEFVKDFRHDLWVIGGARLFKALEPLCTEVHHTCVHLKVHGDTQYVGNHIGWETVDDTGDRISSNSQISYRIRVYRRPFSLKGCA